MAVFINFALILQATLFATCVHSTFASAFLKSRSHGELGQVTLEIIESTLLAELSMDSERLKQFESDLWPMYAALPKNAHGTLEPAAVRYALHRFFVQKHGWYIKGLEPAGQAWNASAPTSVMKSRVPVYIQSLLEQRVNGKGMELRDLAVFAVTMSDFVDNQGLADIMDLYKAFGIPTTTPASKHDVDHVIHAYVVNLLDTTPITSMKDFQDAEGYLIEDFPSYDDYKLWVEDVRQTRALGRSRQFLADQRYTLESVIDEAKTLNDRLGTFQDIECRALKGELAELEYKGTGRVLLSDFYRKGLEGGFPLLIEHVDYLRKLGALDETDPKHPSVIITNYLASQANCLASTSFHDVCCIDECEGLMRHLEHAIAAPTAPVERIAELVAGLHSDTVNAPRNLSASLMSRLAEIADHHEGRVPLHGRLFAQWMHHAYPLECPYPHTAGTTTPLTPDEWMDEFGQDEMAAAEQVRRQHIQEAEGLPLPAATLPWNTMEELVVPTRNDQSASSRVLRKLAAFAVVVALAVPISRVAKSFAMAGKDLSEKSQWV